MDGPSQFPRTLRISFPISADCSGAVLHCNNTNFASVGKYALFISCCLINVLQQHTAILTTQAFHIFVLFTTGNFTQAEMLLKFPYPFEILIINKNVICVAGLCNAAGFSKVVWLFLKSLVLSLKHYMTGSFLLP